MLLLNIFHVHLILYLHVYTHKYVFPNTYMLQGFVYENKFVLYTFFCIFINQQNLIEIPTFYLIYFFVFAALVSMA